MKKLVVLFTVLLSVSSVFSQNQKYVDAMNAARSGWSKAKTVEDYQAMANQFERIASVEKSEWLPNYYAALCYVLMAMRHTDSEKQDLILDKAQNYIDAGLVLTPTESEFFALQGLLYNARIGANNTRGAVYSLKALEAYDKALELNPINPRAYYLKGTSVFYTPKFYGGGTEKPSHCSKKQRNYLVLQPYQTSYYLTGEQRVTKKCY